MVRVDFKIPPSLRAAGKAEALREGVDFSAYVRDALAFRIAWTTAVRAMQAGMDPDTLLDVAAVVECLEAVSRNRLYTEPPQ